MYSEESSGLSFLATKSIQEEHEATSVVREWAVKSSICATRLRARSLATVGGTARNHDLKPSLSYYSRESEGPYFMAAVWNEQVHEATGLVRQWAISLRMGVTRLRARSLFTLG